MQLDHLFMFVPDEQIAHQMMEDAGLRVNYARRHPGQGTRNLCACLDDVFFELLWADGSDATDESRNIGLERRSQGHGSPLGISWRGDAPFACEAYAAPFLPEGVTIPVAIASRDEALPFMFRTPGGQPPVARTDGLTGNRQMPRFAHLLHCELRVPEPSKLRPFTAPMERLSVVSGKPGFHVVMADAGGREAGSFAWQAPDWPEKHP
ncbi:VOC family protein [uncultured Roseobacter sp.]|uniref:VOC family protein n=1 Tax=uncultured Roseobacter sp. TaxID=114847 RepID=UPI00261ECEE8|nr:VOC family protein [uncultured Roseobacter sp.]